jgi:hypothetical protein
MPRQPTGGHAPACPQHPRVDRAVPSAMRKPWPAQRQNPPPVVRASSLPRNPTDPPTSQPSKRPRAEPKERRFSNRRPYPCVLAASRIMMKLHRFFALCHNPRNPVLTLQRSSACSIWEKDRIGSSLTLPVTATSESTQVILLSLSEERVPNRPLQRTATARGNSPSPWSGGLLASPSIPY